VKRITIHDREEVLDKKKKIEDSWGLERCTRRVFLELVQLTKSTSPLRGGGGGGWWLGGWVWWFWFGVGVLRFQSGPCKNSDKQLK